MEAPFFFPWCFVSVEMFPPVQHSGQTKWYMIHPNYFETIITLEQNSYSNFYWFSYCVTNQEPFWISLFIN